MTWQLTGAISGTAQTGLTTPTYTAVADAIPDPAGKQAAFTALGGTQPSVLPHSIAAPFTITLVKPKVLKTLGKPDPVTGQLRSVPRNTWWIIGRKGVLPLAGQPYQTAVIRMQIDIPAGADLADPNSVRALMSAFIGALSNQSAGLGDTLVSGIV